MLAITSLLLQDAGVYECEAKEDIFNVTIRSLGVLTIQGEGKENRYTSHN